MDRASKKKKEKRKKKKYHLSNRVYHHHQISFILSFSLFFLHPNTRLHHTLHHRPIRGSGIEQENVTKMNVCTQHQGLLTSVSPFLLLSFTADLVAHLFITWALIYIYIRVYTSHRSPLVHDWHTSSPGGENVEERGRFWTRFFEISISMYICTRRMQYFHDGVALLPAMDRKVRSEKTEWTNF